MKNKIERLQKAIMTAYVRQLGYKVSLCAYEPLFTRISYAPYQKREDAMLGYVVYHKQNQKIYTKIHYEQSDNLTRIAMILTHEIGHVLIAALTLNLQDEIKENSHTPVEEGLLEFMSANIWKDSIFQLDLFILGIKGPEYVYKDKRIFKNESYYEEYKNLYLVIDAVLKDFVYQVSFLSSQTKVDCLLSKREYEVLMKLCEETSLALETLFLKDVKNSSILSYYYEDYFYKKEVLGDEIKRLCERYKTAYTMNQYQQIKDLFNLYMQNPKALSQLPFTDEQKEKYGIGQYVRKDDFFQKLEKMSKIELHLHLDGSVRKETMEEILGINLKEEDVSVSKIGDLNDYLTKFKLPLSCMQTQNNIRRITAELLEDLSKENIIYAEIRFAPAQHLEKGLSISTVIEAAIQGLLEVPLVKAKLILCMMRGSSYLQNKEIIDMAKKYKDVVAVDLAGAEGMYPTELYMDLFTYAKIKKIAFTIHAGEAAGCESIESALLTGTKRIGHGVRILESDVLIKKAIQNRVLFEVCPTSNVQTGVVGQYNEHPIYEMYQKGLKVSINTDNRTVSHITLSDEYKLLAKYFPFTLEDFKKMNQNAIEGSFLSPIDKERLLERLDF